MSRKRLLIIDGDEVFTQELVDVAERRGFEVLTSSSSVEGLEFAATHAPDLVVVNVELAPTNGWSVCTKLKKDDALSHIPVVLTSSGSTAETFEKHRKLRTRAEEYLLKPYSASDLLEIAGGLLGLPALGEPLVEVDDTFDDDEFEDHEFEDYAVDDDPTTVSEEQPMAFDDADDFGGLDDEPDPLAAAADDLDWASDPLDGPLASGFGDEEVIAFDEEVQPLPEPPPAFEALKAFSRGEFETSEFSAGALAAMGDDFDAESGDDVFEIDASDDAWEAEEVEPLGGFDVDANLSSDEFVHVEEASDETFATAEFVAFEDASFEDLAALDVADAGNDPLDTPAYDQAALEVPIEAADEFDDEEFVDDLGGEFDDGDFDEAPLEVPVEAAAESSGEEFVDDLGSALDDGDFDLDGVGLGGDGFGSENLARVGELEAQLDGLRAVEATREAEVARLRDELANRDQSLRELHAQVEAKDRELQESNARHEAEASRTNAEKVRREATLKSLTARGEQLLAAVRKNERELTTLRPEAARVVELQARAGELESQLATANELGVELEAVRTQLAAAQKQLEERSAAYEVVEKAKTTAEAQLESLKIESESLRTDLDETRRTAERALENAGTLQEKLAEANERVQAAEARVDELEKANSTARNALLHLVEGLGTA